MKDVENHNAIKDMAAAFARQEMAPYAAEWDATSHFPVDVLKKAASLGLAALYVREDIGGSNMSRLEAAVILEELARACPSTAAFLSIHNMVTWLIDRFGTEEQRQKYGPRLCSMEIMASYCLTEPGSGSDAASLKTRAKILTNPADSLNNIYVINGAKAFISGGGASDIYLVMARTGGDGPGGISAFIVEKDFPGLGFGAQEKKLGWKSQPTAAVTFDDCQVPAENLLGGEGNGFKLAMAGLDGGRVNIAACSLGGAAECLDRATQYAQERKQFGKAIADFQATGFKLADMATNLDAARLMVHDACMAIDMEAPDKTVKAAKAKRLATDACYQVVDDALQIHGGYGYLADYEIERYKRDLRVHRILEGTNEIMRVIISRDLLSSGRNH